MRPVSNQQFSASKLNTLTAPVAILGQYFISLHSIVPLMAAGSAAFYADKLQHLLIRAAI